MIIALSFLILSQLSPQPTSRTVEQVAGDWQIYYRLQNAGDTAVELSPADVHLRISGWLSNSHVPSHATPRHVECKIDGEVHPAASADVIVATEDAKRCRERVLLWLAPGDLPWVAQSRGCDPEPLVTHTIEPGDVVRVRIRLEHQHDICGDIDPLLGNRKVEIRLGTTTIRDILNLEREQYFHLPDRDWKPMSSIPQEYMDDGIFFSAPDSLILDASQSGHQYFRFPERKVRGAVRMRIRFRYFISPDCDGEVKVRVAQYKEGKNAWKVLGDGGFDRVLRKPTAKPTGKRGEVKPGEWLVFEEVFVTQQEATTAAFDFRISESDIGLAWIDDFEVSYVGVGNGPITP